MLMLPKIRIRIQILYNNICAEEDVHVAEDYNKDRNERGSALTRIILNLE